MNHDLYKGRFLTLRIIATLLIITFITLPYVTTTPNFLSAVMFFVTLGIFYALESSFRKAQEQAEEATE